METIKTKTIILIIVPLLVILTAVFLWRGDRGEIKKEDIAVSPTPTVTGTYEQLMFPNGTLDTSNWQTYRNEEFGFEVKYPGDWEVTLKYSGYDGSGEPVVIRPTKRSGPNDDGGVYIFFDDSTLEEIMEDPIVTGDFNRGDFKRILVNNNLRLIVIDYKLGVWNEDYGYPDTRNIYQRYVYDAGVSRVSLYEPSQDDFRTAVLEQVVLSFKLTK